MSNKKEKKGVNRVMKGYLQQMSKEDRDKVLGYAKVQLGNSSRYKHIPQDKIRFIEIVCPQLEEPFDWDKLEEKYWVDDVYAGCIEIPCDIILLDINGNYIETKEEALSQFYIAGEPFYGDRDWADYDIGYYRVKGYTSKNKAIYEFLSDNFQSTYGTSGPSILDEDTKRLNYKFLFTTDEFDFIEKLDIHSVYHAGFSGQIHESLFKSIR